jgi:hypothetical protein
MSLYLSLLPHGEWVFGFWFSFASWQRLTASSEHPKMLRALLTEGYGCGSDL